MHGPQAEESCDSFQASTCGFASALSAKRSAKKTLLKSSSDSLLQFKVVRHDVRLKLDSQIILANYVPRSVVLALVPVPS